MAEIPSENNQDDISSTTDNGEAGLDLSQQGMVEPTPQNRIVFSECYQDRFRNPQISIEYRLGVEDARQATTMLADMIEVAEYLGDYLPLALQPGTVKPSIQPSGTSLHLMGTFRMGDDPKTSVVYVNLKVWGFDNLHLDGPGVIPNKNEANLVIENSMMTFLIELRGFAPTCREPLGRAIGILEYWSVEDPPMEGWNIGLEGIQPYWN